MEGTWSIRTRWGVQRRREKIIPESVENGCGNPTDFNKDYIVIIRLMKARLGPDILRNSIFPQRQPELLVRLGYFRSCAMITLNCQLGNHGMKFVLFCQMGAIQISI